MSTYNTRAKHRALRKINVKHNFKKAAIIPGCGQNMHVFQSLYVCACVRACVRVCVSERERHRERETNMVSLEMLG